MNNRELLTFWRKAADLTQQQAAEALGFDTKQTISDKERGVFGTTERDVKLIHSHARANGIELPEAAS